MAALGGMARISGRQLRTRGLKERAAQPDRTSRLRDGTATLLETSANPHDGGGCGGPTLAAPESGRKFQLTDRKKRATGAHGLYSDPAHKIAEVLSGGPLLHPTPAVGAIKAEFSKRTHEHRILGDTGMREQFAVDHDAALLVEA